MWDLVLEHLPTLIGTVLVFAVIWGVRKIGLKKEAEEAIISMTKRVVDKSQEWLHVAMQPDSDGGAKITSAEASVIRQKVFDLLKSEVTGPVGKVLFSLSENWIKGKIGDALAKVGVKVDLVGA